MTHRQIHQKTSLSTKTGLEARVGSQWMSGEKTNQKNMLNFLLAYNM